MTKKKKAEELTDLEVARRLFPKKVREAIRKEVREPEPTEKSRVKRASRPTKS